MTQHAVRKIKRSTTSASRMGRGLLLSIAFTVAAVLVFAIIIGLFDVSDSVIQAVNQLIKILAIFLGVRSIVGKNADHALRQGALLGLIYMGVGVLLYALLSGQQVTPLGYLIDLLMGIAAGGLSGMILGKNR